MNKAEIIAELRRSAREDQRPWIGVRGMAWNMAVVALENHEPSRLSDHDDTAMFFLIVAEAMEQES